MSIETFKPALAAWLEYRELGDMARVWHDKPICEDAPTWAEVGLLTDDGGICRVFDSGGELYDEFEKLLEKHKVWWEMDGAWLWIFPEDAFNHIPIEQDPRISLITFRE